MVPTAAPAATGGCSAALLDVLEPGVQHFLNAVQLGAPQVAHLVESPIDSPETAIHVVEPGIHVSAQFADARVGVVQSGIVYQDAAKTASIAGTAAKAIVRSWVPLIPTPVVSL